MKNYLLSTALVASLGLNGVLVGAGAVAQASNEQNRITHVSAEYPAGNAVMLNIKSRIDAAMGPLCDSAEGWDAGTCTVQLGTTTCFTWNDPVLVNTDFHNDGTWTKGSPE